MERFLRSVQPAAHVLAADVFGDLDAELVPRVALVGLPSPEDPDGPVEVVGDAEGVDAEALRSVWHRTLRRVSTTENPSEADDLLRRAVHDAVAAVDEPRGVATFGSSLATVGEGRVWVLLRMAKNAYGSYHALSRQNLGAGGLPLAGSLLDAAVHEFLHAVASGLAEFRPGVGPATLPRSHDEILRSAARLLMHQPAWVAGNAAGAAGLFLACDSLSAMRYEGGEGRGEMLVTPRGHPNVRSVLTFHSPISLHDHRGVRKV